MQSWLLWLQLLFIYFPGYRRRTRRHSGGLVKPCSPMGHQKKQLSLKRNRQTDIRCHCQTSRSKNHPVPSWFLWIPHLFSYFPGYRRRTRRHSGGLVKPCSPMGHQKKQLSLKRNRQTDMRCHCQTSSVLWHMHTSLKALYNLESNFSTLIKPND